MLKNNNFNNSSVEIEIQFEKHEDYYEKVNSKTFQSEFNMCKEEIIKTQQSCANFLKLDQKKLDSVKSRFNEIKQNIETSEVVTKCNMSNCDNSDILETKEHFEILRKMYQETTHKLMIFRNALKDRNFMNQQQNNLTNSSNYSSNNSIKASSSVTSSENNDNYAMTSSSSSKTSSNASTILNQMVSNTKGPFSWNQALKTEVSFAKQFSVQDAKAKELRKLGFGTVLSHQMDGISRGTGAVVTLAKEKENLVVGYHLLDWADLEGENVDKHGAGN